MLPGLGGERHRQPEQVNLHQLGGRAHAARPQSRGVSSARPPGSSSSGKAARMSCGSLSASQAETLGWRPGPAARTRRSCRRHAPRRPSAWPSWRPGACRGRWWRPARSRAPAARLPTGRRTPIRTTSPISSTSTVKVVRACSRALVASSDTRVAASSAAASACASLQGRDDEPAGDRDALGGGRQRQLRGRRHARNLQAHRTPEHPGPGQRAGQGRAPRRLPASGAAGAGGGAGSPGARRSGRAAPASQAGRRGRRSSGTRNVPQWPSG